MEKLKNNTFDIEIKEYCYLDEACAYIALGWEPIEDYLKCLPEFENRHNDFDNAQEKLCSYYQKIEDIKYYHQQNGAIDICDKGFSHFIKKFKQEYNVLLSKEKSLTINKIYNQYLSPDGIKKKKIEKIDTLSWIFARGKVKGLIAEMEDAIKPWQNKINQLEENNPFIIKILNAKKRIELAIRQHKINFIYEVDINCDYENPDTNKHTYIKHNLSKEAITDVKIQWPALEEIYIKIYHPDNIYDNIKTRKFDQCPLLCFEEIKKIFGYKDQDTQDRIKLIKKTAQALPNNILFVPDAIREIWQTLGKTKDMPGYNYNTVAGIIKTIKTNSGINRFIPAPKGNFKK